jgi:L-fuculose-phosphate aldolase
MDIQEAKQMIWEAGKRLLAEGLVKGTWGNISLRIGRETMVITPSGREYQDLKPDEMVEVNIHTYEYKGNIKPSSAFKMHADIYRSRKEINAVIHTHPPSASTVAAARREVPPVLDDMAQLIGPSVRVADYARSSSRKMNRVALKALKGRMACLLANNGAVCIGRNMEEAFVVSQVLEKACRAFIEAEFLGGAKSIGKVEAYLMHQYYLNKYSKQKKGNR